MLSYYTNGAQEAAGFADEPCVYFSKRFELAREYAGLRGGERIDGALRGGTKMCAILENTDRIQGLISDWESKLRAHGRPHLETQQVIERLRNADLLKHFVYEIRQAERALSDLLTGSHPVIYVLQADPSTMDRIAGGFRVPRLPADQIIARVDYVNGISVTSFFVTAVSDLTNARESKSALHQYGAFAPVGVLDSGASHVCENDDGFVNTNAKILQSRIQSVSETAQLPEWIHDPW